MAIRLFLYKEGGEHVAAFEATDVPRVGEAVWCKTLDFEGTLVVESVEHQFDRSGVETYRNQDVSLFCRTK